MSRSLHTDPYFLRAARRVSAPVAVRMHPARRGFIHPAGDKDVTNILDFFGPSVGYGLRGVELRHADGGGRPRLVLATLKVPGMIVLYEQPLPPWTFRGRLAPSSLERLRRAGACIDRTENATHVEWPADTLRDFMLFDGLMHEIGHHIVQHATGKRRARVMRTADHERRADAFADACRQEWNARGAVS